ncbi:DUF488 family protein [Vulgatibacter sp.]|uniref:DUF488 domain-containing protein n=1 Tax=Vulgatibacter sp. TaxID=1971226 RepID=UPI003566552F
MRLFSIGHSTRTLPLFFELLRAHGIRGVIDVRAIPASGRQPWFNRQPFAAAMRAEGFAYEWMGDSLGGGRAEADLPEVAGLKEPAMRGYAAWMATPAFAAGIERLIELGGRLPTAFMCAEAAPAGCHRLLLCDALVLRGVEVVHAIDPRTALPHQRHPNLLPRGLVPTYPPLQASLF